MLSAELLDILVCPETKQAVHVAPGELVTQVNEQIRQGIAKNRSGLPVTERVDGLLVRADNKFAYAVRDDIPVMLIDEAIPLS